jgi:hypothetical protein
MLFIRHPVKKQRKEPVQLELFVPHQEGYKFKVIVTKGQDDPFVSQRSRGTREHFLGVERPVHHGLRAHSPSVWNMLYYQSAVLAHNLYRELQMTTRSAERVTTAKRSALCCYDEKHRFPWSWRFDGNKVA